MAQSYKKQIKTVFNRSRRVNVSILILCNFSIIIMVIMKNGMRLAASFSPPFPAGGWTRKFMTIVGMYPSFRRLQCQGIESLGRGRRAMHGLSCEDDFSELGPSMNENGAKQLRLATEKPEPRMVGKKKANPDPLGKLVRRLSCEDDFSELGPPVTENGAKQLRLVTEKPAPRMACKKKANPASQGKLSQQLSADGKPNLMDIVLGTRKISHPSNIKVQNRSVTPSFAVQNQTLDQDEGQTLDNCSVSVENIPSTFTLADLVLGMSVFGNVSSARISTVSDLHRCDVEFEDSESSKRAALAGEVTIKNIQLPIRSSNFPDVVTVRIEGIHTETTDSTVHTICRSVGALVGLEMAGQNAVNAFYRVRSGKELQNIVKRLNNNVINDQSWSAKQLPSKPASSSVPQKDDGRSESELGIINRVDSLQKKWERQLAMKKIHLEDLQLLHQGIIHLQGQ